MKQTSESPFLNSLSVVAERFKSGDRLTQLQELSGATGELGRQQGLWPNFAGIVGSSSVIRAVLSRVSKVAPTDSSVLIMGETGTGKELIARAIHQSSARAGQKFIAVNCAAIPPALIASELFGHERGAFTGALQRRVGRFELARGGTLFLDEIGELPMEIQIMLLRVLQEREFERVGGTEPIRADVRLITATNRNLKQEAIAGRFRNDLYFRLNVFEIEMPPLRARSQDIPQLTKHFVRCLATKLGKKIISISTKTLETFQSYPWPGNVRELQNIVERSLILCEGETFAADESWVASEFASAEISAEPLTAKLAADEKSLIEAALAEANGRVAGPLGAATRLGLSASTLESKIRSLRINKHQFKSYRFPPDRIKV
jgi:transcriptional regulator with GAF, ATPase, and Fis domain